jgi:hypothetical protein
MKVFPPQEYFLLPRFLRWSDEVGRELSFVSHSSIENRIVEGDKLSPRLDRPIAIFLADHNIWVVGDRIIPRITLFRLLKDQPESTTERYRINDSVKDHSLPSLL